jgi:hypothetical protein
VKWDPRIITNLNHSWEIRGHKNDQKKLFGYCLQGRARTIGQGFGPLLVVGIIVFDDEMMDIDISI